ncbi:MAG: hypothetical protein GDA54_05495 [Alphaproteobacteria bacterium GM7ARS4]|nr:hypothetical protein [Alphaproteobacteria bacterium GM7ARS4]
MVTIVKKTRLLLCGVDEHADSVYDHYRGVLSGDDRVELVSKRCRTLYEGNGVVDTASAYDGAVFCVGQNTRAGDVYSALHAVRVRHGNDMVCLVARAGVDSSQGDTDAAWVEHGFDGVMRGVLDADGVLDRQRCLALLRDRWRGLGNKESSEGHGTLCGDRWALGTSHGEGAGYSCFAHAPSR